MYCYTNKGSGSKYGLMGPNMKVPGTEIRPMGKESSIISMVTYIRVNSLIML